MKRCLLVCVFFAIQFSAQGDAPWRSLFNGEDLEGWVVVDPPVQIEAREGGVVMRMTPHTSRHSFLRTEERFEDFIFEVQFRRDVGMDSGVLLRAVPAPDDSHSALLGYMVKVDPRQNRRWTGGVFLDYGDGWNWLYSLENDEQARAAELPEGQWNRLRVEAIGDAIKVWLNGTPTAHLRDDRYEDGYIALKIHYLNAGNATKAGLEIAYREARVLTENLDTNSQPMDLPPLDTRADVEITRFR